MLHEALVKYFPKYIRQRLEQLTKEKKEREEDGDLDGRDIMLALHTSYHQSVGSVRAREKLPAAVIANTLKQLACDALLAAAHILASEQTYEDLEEDVVEELPEFPIKQRSLSAPRPQDANNSVQKLPTS